MKAGLYAVIDGEEYSAFFQDGVDRIRITVWPGQRHPAGFTGEPMFYGTVEGTLPRSRASRLYEIETWALLYGRFPVQVDRINPDGVAAVAMPIYESTPVGEPVRDEQYAKVIPPGLSGHPADTWFFGGAPVEELSNTHQTVHEFEV
ncbi:hypothetical protein AA0Y32_03625 [Georgenia phoenicis]|uniref:hypothetical protein n=1 Tax=unclassified Georgenia TaxID=2626815 RepID=UPI0039AF4C8A